MKTNFSLLSRSLAAMLVLAFLMTSALVQAEETGAVAAVETAVKVDVIVKIDKESRTITLKDEETGEKWTFFAGQEVRNFDQLNRGDLVLTEYFAGFALALEPKGSGLEERISDTELDRAKPGEKPGMSYTESTYVEAMISAVYPELSAVTLQGPEGSLTMMVDSAIDLSQIDVGQEVEILYVESYAISVEPAPKVSGTVKMKITSVAIGIGVEWGKGTLTMYDGTTHDFKISGLTLVDVGASAVEATGEAYHLVEAKDFEGTFVSGEAGAVLIGGGSAMTMKNGNGVVVNLKSSQKGVRLTLAVEGLKIKLK